MGLDVAAVAKPNNNDCDCIYKACPSESGTSLTVSIVSWTNGTLVSTNKVDYV
jgi:hypothetical protein